MNPVRLAQVKQNLDRAQEGLREAATELLDGLIQESPNKYAQCPQRFVAGLRCAVEGVERAHDEFVAAYSEDVESADREARNEWRDDLARRVGRNVGTRIS